MTIMISPEARMLEMELFKHFEGSYYELINCVDQYMKGRIALADLDIMLKSSTEHHNDMKERFSLKMNYLKARKLLTTWTRDLFTEWHG